MRYTLFLLSIIFLFSCNDNGPNPEEKKQVQGLFASGDTINLTVSKLVGETNLSYYKILANGDSFFTVQKIVERIGTYTYSVPTTDTFTKKVVTTTPPVIPPVTPPTTGTRNNLIFEAGFDGTKPFMTENELYQQKCCSYSITQSKSIVRTGDGSFWALVKGSDPSSSSGYRSEFITKASYNTDAWYGYSTYFENWSACSSCGEHVIQWHPAEGSGSANLGIYTEKNTFRVGLNKDGDLTAESTLADGQKIVANKWYDFVWHVKWSSSAGRIELWVDGVKYVDYSGATLTKGGTPYFKFGINRWNISGVTRSLYYDNLRIGNANATYKDVAP